MAQINEKETQPKNGLNLGSEQAKRILEISTNGQIFEITKTELSLFEVREICRQILQKTGGL